MARAESTLCILGAKACSVGARLLHIFVEPLLPMSSAVLSTRGVIFVYGISLTQSSAQGCSVPPADLNVRVPPLPNQV